MELNLPEFDMPMKEPPSPLSADEALAAFEEIIAELKLLESEPPRRDFIEPFVL